MYDFDTVYNRTGLGSEKWDGALLQGKPSDIVPLSVADMEFRTAPEIIEAVREMADFGLWGYTHGNAAFKEAVTGWMARRQGWQPQPEWMVNTAGVVAALYAAVRAFTEEGESIIIQPPVYPPFFSAIDLNNRKIIENPLKLENNQYVMDLEDLRAKAPKAKMMILCSPHNPVGRVWSKRELLAVANICAENNLVLFVDEIHSDLIIGSRPFTAYRTLDEKYQKFSIIGTAASKTFSLAGLSCSSIFIANPQMRSRLEKQLAVDGAFFNSTFGVVATTAAYEKGEPWLEALLSYIRNNYLYVKRYLQQNLPMLTVCELEGTYLAWLNFEALQLPPEELDLCLKQKANLFLNAGYSFGTGGAGFMRMNLACPRIVLEESLNRLKEALKLEGFMS